MPIPAKPATAAPITNTRIHEIGLPPDCRGVGAVDAPVVPVVVGDRVGVGVSSVVGAVVAAATTIGVPVLVGDATAVAAGVAVAGLDVGDGL